MGLLGVEAYCVLAVTRIVRLLLPGSSHLNETDAKVLTGKNISDALTLLPMMLIFGSLKVSDSIWYHI
jgi:hypothetical protein